MYARRANKEKAVQLNLTNVNEYIGLIFGKDKKEEKKAMAEDDPKNFIWKIKEARDNLTMRTGRKEFTLQEIWTEIGLKKRLNK